MTAAPRQACRFIATNGHRYTNVLGITPRIWNMDECTMYYVWHQKEASTIEYTPQRQYQKYVRGRYCDYILVENMIWRDYV